MLQRRRNAKDGDAAGPNEETSSKAAKDDKQKRWNVKSWIKSRTRIVLFTVLGLVILIILVNPRWVARLVRQKRKGRIPSTNVVTPVVGEEPPEEVWTVATLDETLKTLRADYMSEEALKSTSISFKKLTVAVPKPFKHSHRSFGCMRDTCRGLEIEDLFDRGFHRYFRSALKNDSAQGYNMNANYRVTILLLDTTQLNHMKTTVPQLYKKVWETQLGSTYVIAFEGGDAMGGNKGFQLRQKDRFTRSFNCSYDDLRIQPVQYRLYVKSECDALMERSKTDKTTNFLLKPEAGSQGQGITFHSSADEIFEKRSEFYPCQTRHGIPATSRFLVQEYISHPLLLAKCKFDARVYLYASSADPFLLWYHRGYLRRSLTPYSPTTRDRKAYLTNTHFQSSRANFNMSEHIWTFERMQSQLVRQKQAPAGFVESVVEPWMKEVAQFVFESAREKILPRRGSSQIIGLDFMLDENLRLHFIEANGYPGFTWSVNFDSRGMVEDMFDLMTQQGEAPGLFKYFRPGDRFGGFQLVHSDARPHRIPYNPCAELADNALLGRVIHAATQVAVNSALPRAFNELDNELAKLIEAFPLQARDSCGMFVAPLYAIGDASDCRTFLASLSSNGDQTSKVTPKSPVAVVENFSAGNQKFLFPNASICQGMVLPKREDSCSGLQGKSLIVQLIAQNELRLPLEKLAYPGGRFPLAPFSRDGLAAWELFAKGLDPMNKSERFVPSPKDPVRINADRIFAMFASSFEQQDLKIWPVPLNINVIYRVRWFLYISRSPLMVLTHPGYAFSIRRFKCDEHYETFRSGEHSIDLDLLQDILSNLKLAPARYVVSIVEPAIRQVAEHLVFKLLLANGDDTSHSFSSSLFSLDWSIQASSLVPKLLSVKRLSSVEGLDVEGVALKTRQTLTKSRSRLESILRSAPTFFARSRRGDSFEQFRFVYNHFEFQRFENFEPEQCKDPFPSRRDLDFAIEFENVHLKQKNSIHRDLNKRITKRWQVCRVKRSEEAKFSCMRSLLSERYRVIVRQHRLVSDESRWIKQTFESLGDFAPIADDDGLGDDDVGSDSHLKGHGGGNDDFEV